MKFFIMLFIIVLAILSATMLLALLGMTVEEDEDFDKDMQNKIFRFSMNKRKSWKKAAFLWGIIGFLNTYQAIFLIEPIPHGYYAVIAFGVAVAQRNNTKEVYVSINNGEMSIYRNAFLGTKSIYLPSLLRVELTKRHFRFYQENVLVGKVSLKFLHDGDEERLKSDIEEYIKVKRNH